MYILLSQALRNLKDNKQYYSSYWLCFEKDFLIECVTNIYIICIITILNASL